MGCSVNLTSDPICIDAEPWSFTYRGRLQNPTVDRPVVSPGSRRLSLFRTIEYGQNWTEPPVNRRLGFEVVSYVIHWISADPIDSSESVI